ncbi:hypothetical protein H2201_001831 [Coniosporium apollinis]|uniref:Uncharacterized protein n=1 Tax=Coniosporium apollinis TaxID=61459 RepID=A0ABQ9P095_9PEZI|nr:hypothetical protein H2201_001831 [Coniosporium apollinis]
MCREIKVTYTGCGHSSAIFIRCKINADTGTCEEGINKQETKMENVCGTCERRATEAFRRPSV